mmetsp:Transcript_6106/g.14100  ORF Transcript_6106/g.14100 Transcript_6106/m.14100 type:complete len:92 (+) Transcript_6106:115-390(+)
MEEMEELCEKNVGAERLRSHDRRSAFSSWLIFLTCCFISFLLGMATMYMLQPNTNRKQPLKSRIEMLKDCEDLICSTSNYIEAQCRSLCGP